MKRWILLHLFPELVSMLRMLAAYEQWPAPLARQMLEEYDL